ncbi:hypothetical protein V512_000130 [Mesotoga sp. Brook.08.105.5.1]|uniref:formylglycine-generating enzyme family protein n=1 Tax=Mesotoga sp. Brook.08.105.5.1 TaxID=1421002 RepID=UPI000C18BD2C|nr:SUMF1/EgtB/PvdO family nonheme iron enzyme [Mesotoga sp. Brook.08.105.5.1]PVD15357.1 hypothetical protein V512_000130 [Mesotoga sp. Brook.08.105.5.1]
MKRLLILLLIVVFAVMLAGCKKPRENQPPVLQKIGGSEGVIDCSANVLEWSASDPDGTIAKYYVNVDEAGWDDYGLETEYVWNDYGTGVHSFEVKAEDNEGTFSNIISWNFVAIEEMILVEGGKFTMGDTWGDGYENELPLHEVTIDYDYFIGKYEVTFDEFDAFCDDLGRTKPKDFSWGRERRPVISVSWYDAIAYCNWLSDKAGLARAYDDNGNLLDLSGGMADDPSEVIGFRLPTEAEWEFAARGGDSESLFKYSGSNDPDEVAWYRENAHNDIVDSISTWPVGEKEPNGLGIHDMSGNVFEWCTEPFQEYTADSTTNPYVPINGSTDFIIRGGSYFNIARLLRVPYREEVSGEIGIYVVGFRIVRTDK